MATSSSPLTTLQKHAFGLSTYVLQTRAGRLYSPLCRGSGFLLPYEQGSFYFHHVMTSQHVVKLHKFKDLLLARSLDGAEDAEQQVRFNPLTGATLGEGPTTHRYEEGAGEVEEFLSRIGERHLNFKAFPMCVEGKNFKGVNSVRLHHSTFDMPLTHVTALRIFEEADQLQAILARHRAMDPPREDADFTHHLVPVEIDEEPLQAGESVFLEGIDSREDSAANSPVATPGTKSEPDQGLEMNRGWIKAVCKVSWQSKTFGSTVLATTGDVKVPQGFSGGPVLRASNGKCVGVINTPVRTHKDQPEEFVSGGGQFKIRAPTVDVSRDKDLNRALSFLEGDLNPGLVDKDTGEYRGQAVSISPITAFLKDLRKTENI